MTRKPHLICALLACTTMLANCGGGGSIGVNSAASVPGPAALAPAASTPVDTRTPLPLTPATTSGSYQAIASFASTDASGAQSVALPDGRRVLQGPIELTAPDQLAPKGSVNLTVEASTRSYTLTVAAGPYSFPAGHMAIPAGSPLGFDRNNADLSGSYTDWVARGDMLTGSVGAGTAPNGAPRAATSWLRLYNVGQQNGSPRYLSAAEWGQSYSENSSGVPGPENFRRTQETSGVLVFGQRTASGDIPVSGSAHYALNSMIQLAANPAENPLRAGLNTVLDVDFASRELSAAYDWSLGEDIFQTDEWSGEVLYKNGQPIVLEHHDLGVHASGSSMVSNDGSFGITLGGTGKVHTVQNDKTPVADIATPVSGSLTGAFFGPQAAEVGGIAMLPNISSDGTVHTSTDAFGGIRQAP